MVIQTEKMKEVNAKIEEVEAKMSSNIPLQTSQLAHNICAKSIEQITSALKHALNTVIKVQDVPKFKQAEMQKQMQRQNKQFFDQLNIDFSLGYEEMDKKLLKYKRAYLHQFVEGQADNQKKDVAELAETNERLWKQELGQIRANKRKKYEELEATNPRIDFESLRVDK